MTSAPTLDGGVQLSDLGVLCARGPDAATFLQGQLSNDVLSLGPDTFRYAAFCSAQGRVQASFLVWRPDPELVYLVCAADLLAATLKRLSMFVLRAKCRLTDATAEFQLHGCVGETARQVLGDTPLSGVRRLDAGVACRLADVDGQPRALLCRPAGAGSPVLPELAATHWAWLAVRSGVAQIQAATTDLFVPQMLNFELIGAVDFKKGCYPGQEVVARSQYRGTLKRRLALFACDSVARPGQEVFHTADPAQPAGAVVNFAADPQGGPGGLALICVKRSALADGALHLDDAPTLALHPTPLPYPLPEDAVTN